MQRSDEGRKDEPFEGDEKEHPGQTAKANSNIATLRNDTRWFSFKNQGRITPPHGEEEQKASSWRLTTPRFAACQNTTVTDEREEQTTGSPKPHKKKPASESGSRLFGKETWCLSYYASASISAIAALRLSLTRPRSSTPIHLACTMSPTLTTSSTFSTRKSASSEM